jgi:hypothetical protein
MTELAVFFFLSWQSTRGIRRWRRLRFNYYHAEWTCRCVGTWPPSRLLSYWHSLPLNSRGSDPKITPSTLCAASDNAHHAIMGIGSQNRLQTTHQTIHFYDLANLIIECIQLTLYFYELLSYFDIRRSEWLSFFTAGKYSLRQFNILLRSF